jgi:hypothetical protein
MSRTEYCLDPAFESLACAGSHVGLCAVDILARYSLYKGDEDEEGVLKAESSIAHGDRTG